MATGDVWVGVGASAVGAVVGGVIGAGSSVLGARYVDRKALRRHAAGVAGGVRAFLATSAPIPMMIGTSPDGSDVVEKINTAYAQVGELTGEFHVVVVEQRTEVAKVAGDLIAALNDHARTLSVVWLISNNPAYTQDLPPRP